jgi:hypothetical protein
MDIENLDQLVARKSDIISCSIRTDVPRFFLNEYCTFARATDTMIWLTKLHKNPLRITL